MGGHFSPAFFRFLRELHANNRREWFNANKERFLRDVRDPMIAFIGDFALRLKKISPCFVADPAPTGGSMLRIYRDTRFAKDKSPYKTHMAARFQHASCGEEMMAPGFYISLAPGQCFTGAGMWHPEPAVAQKIRGAIAAQPAKWRAAVRSIKLEGDSLVRPPRGFSPEHPLIADLRRKDFICGQMFKEREVCAPDFVDRYARSCRSAAPLVKFLTEAVGLKF